MPVSCRSLAVCSRQRKQAHKLLSRGTCGFLLLLGHYRAPSSQSVLSSRYLSLVAQAWAPPLRARLTTQRSATLLSNEIINPDSNALHLPGAATTAIHSVAAPMVAATDYAFRCLCRQHGVDLTFTQMLHARNLVESPHFGKTHLDLYEGGNVPGMLLPVQQVFLQGAQEFVERNLLINTDTSRHHSVLDDNTSTQGPVIVQLAGHEPGLVVQAAQMVLQGSRRVDGFDLNCGCPQKIAKKGLYGAFLMEHDNAQTACRVLQALRRSLPDSVAVSAKIRLPSNPDQQSDRIQRLVETTNFLTIHGRTLYENKTRVGPCHVDRIRQAVEVAQQSRPGFGVIANGGVEFNADIQPILGETGAAAIMSSEGLLETPNLFVVDSSQHYPAEWLQQQFQMTRDYLFWCYRFPPLPGVLGQGGCMTVARGHVFKFLHRYWQEQVDLRDCLVTVTTWVQLWLLVEELYERYKHLTDPELAHLSSSLASSSWYRRHWMAASRVHQRQRPREETSNSSLSRHGLSALSVEERKELLKKRIAKLQKQTKQGIKLPL